jgi:hypothetical protein
MTCKFSLLIEGDLAGYSAYVPELRSLEESTERAAEAIRVYWENVRIDRSPTSTLREIEVELPA